MKPQRVRGVLIGTGGIGLYHLRQWAKLPAGEIVGVYDVNQHAAQAAAADYGIKRVYGSLAEAVADPQADALDICTPNMLHKEGVLAGLEAGKHCLCEKPLAATAADIEAMIAARDRNGRILMTTQHMRFEDRTQALKRLVDAGRVGEIYYGRAWWIRRRMAPTTPGFLTKAQAGFGPGMDLGVHMVDLAMYLMDQPRPVSVTGVAPCKLAHRPDVANQWGTYDPAQFEVEDLAAGFVRFENGAALSLEVSWLLNVAGHEHMGLWLHGTEGGIRWPEVTFAHVQDHSLADTQIASSLGAHGHRNTIGAFIDAILNDRPSPVPAEESLVVARVLAALYESAAIGHEVCLP